MKKNSTKTKPVGKVKALKKVASAPKVPKSKKIVAKKETFDESAIIEDFIEAVIKKNYAVANKHLKQVVDSRLAGQIASELNTPLFN